MSYYAAAPDRIATTPFDDGIEVTSEQYGAALAVLTDPDDKRIISTDGGVFALVDPPEPEPEPEPEPPTPEEIIEGFRLAIQSHVDAAAQSKNYDSGNSLAGYVASTNPTWAAEAQAFVAWRDAVWIYAYAELDKVTGGQREAPSVEDFIAELPEMVWPS